MDAEQLAADLEAQKAEVARLKALADAEKARADAAEASLATATAAAPAATEAAKDEGAKHERQRVVDIHTWGSEISKLRKIDLSPAIAEHVEKGKSLADFKEHVLKTEFASPSLASGGGASNQRSMKRADFDKLSPIEQRNHCAGGGKITD